LVVRPRVAHQQREERRGSNLQDVQQPDAERDREDGDRDRRKGSPTSCEQWHRWRYASAAMRRSSNRAADRAGDRGARARPIVGLAIAACALTATIAAAQPPPQRNDGGRVTFTKDIAPIVWSRCSPCHRPGEVGPFSLLTDDDVRRRASAIAAVTSRRLMPPWKPLPGKGAFPPPHPLSHPHTQLPQPPIPH